MSILSEIAEAARLFNVAPDRIRHWVRPSVEKNVAEGGAPTSTDNLVTFTVPSARCLIVTRIELDSYPVDSSGNEYPAHRQRNAYHEGLNFYFTVGDEQTTPDTLDSRVFTGEVLFAFKSEAAVKIGVNIPTGGDRQKLSFRVSGLLLPAESYTLAAAMQTRIDM